MLTVKALRFYQEIKHCVSRHCTIALFSLFNVLNHTLEYYRVTTKLPVLHHLYISGHPIISSEPTNRGSTPRDRGTTPALTAAYCFRSFFNPFTRWEMWQWKVRVQNALPLSALCPNLTPPSLWESSPGRLLANPTVLPTPFHYSRRN